jgi:hypothetical protein
MSRNRFHVILHYERVAEDESKFDAMVNAQTGNTVMENAEISIIQVDLNLPIEHLQNRYMRSGEEMTVEIAETVRCVPRTGVGSPSEGRSPGCGRAAIAMLRANGPTILPEERLGRWPETFSREGKLHQGRTASGCPAFARFTDVPRSTRVTARNLPRQQAPSKSPRPCRHQRNGCGGSSPRRSDAEW